MPKTPIEIALQPKPEKVRLTNAEKQARWRTKAGSRCINFRCDIQAAGSLLYIKKQWGLGTDREAVEVALRFLAVQTRKNPDMKILDLEV